VISAQYAISRFRRDMTFGTLLRSLLLAGAAFSLLLSLSPIDGRVDGTMILVVIAAIWLALSYRSARGLRLAAQSPSVIASGQFDQAEAHVEMALRSFSLFRTVKLRTLHHLALLRHAERRWDDAAILSRTVLGNRLGASHPLTKPSRLILADALLELGDLGGAYAAMASLYNHRLTLAEAMELMLVQLDYSARIGAWQAMMSGVADKVQLAELMPAGNSARAQGLLALAAMKCGREDWKKWLADRVELLADVEELCRLRPMLWEVWSRQTAPPERPLATGENRCLAPSA